MPLTRRYSPEIAPGESCLFGMDFSPLLPPSTGIVSASVDVFSNTFAPVSSAAGWTIGPVQIDGRVVYARLSGGTEGQDYQIRWFITDTDGNSFLRTALVLCAQTS